ncbi:MAG: Hsp70 family protein, partial [Defluviitaleaceae bacterium]|nr:Hsp70 family protein [Defluviitaleaceae bacterium]
MNWKKYKLLPKAEKSDESKFILGLDIGNDSSAIAFYDALRGCAEVIDISGGYGRPSVPTVMQYIRETKEWVFGEYAILNRGQGQEVTLGSLVEKLGRREYLEIDGKPVSVVSVLGLFLKEIAASVKNIDPKAEVAGIVASIPSYMSGEAKEELTWAFKSAGLEKELICLAPERECVLASYFKKEGAADGTVLLMDYGSREVRGGAYRVSVKLPSASRYDRQGKEARIKSLSSLFDEELGARRVEASLTEMLLADFPQRPTPRIMEHFSAFLYQHKDLLFQKSARPVKLYMNFVYPPAQAVVPKKRMDALIEPYRARLAQFVTDILGKNIYESHPIAAADVSCIVCSGGGFEMPWVRDCLAEIFPAAKIILPRNPKAVAAEGAALLAAAYLGVEENIPAMTVEDLHQIRADIGRKVRMDGREKFLPLVERN